MIAEFFIEINIPDITASFSNGGRLIKEEILWMYERDGKSCVAREPESALIGAEGMLEGKIIWNSNLKGGE